MDYFNIGKIINTHGIKGAVKIIPLTDEPKRFELLEYVYIDSKKKLQKYTIEDIRYFKNLVIIKFKELEDMTSAEALKESIIKIPRELALPLEDDEYYISDLIGIEVSTDDGEDLGNIKDVIRTGSNDVYVIEADDKKEILIPALKQCIKEVDMENKTMVVSLLEGLID
ncbi:ribosome maturation factor RimM [Vallitalea longa]|uniref:Ribosome maturation factor RimM n=1 Tax=Vallitalea longa TaxID=2936439 RepID=A0A9W5YFC7_9FIRM|nr:ribosome maturation factor RimM [Vallitalea longa]GKX31721.1 ribosome maturation factor RimM [Vallitalea longa]